MFLIFDNSYFFDQTIKKFTSIILFKDFFRKHNFSESVLKMWERKNSKTQNVTTLKQTQIATKLISLYCDKTHKLELWGKRLKKMKLWQNSKPQIVTKLRNSNWNYTKQSKLFKKMQFFGGGFTNLTPWLTMKCFQGSLLQSCDKKNPRFLN